MRGLLVTARLCGYRVDLLVERLVREGRGAVTLDQTRHALPVRVLLVTASLGQIQNYEI